MTKKRKILRKKEFSSSNILSLRAKKFILKFEMNLTFRQLVIVTITLNKSN